MSENVVMLDRVANAPVSEGIHHFVIKSGEEGEGAKGPYWSFTLACTDPGEEGKTTRMIVSLSDTARWRLEIFLDAVGAPKQGSAQMEQFIGRKFRGEVTHEDYEGRAQARIGSMFPNEASTEPRTAKEQPGAAVVSVKAETPKASLPADAVGPAQQSF